jgi:hypothetical protein
VLHSFLNSLNLPFDASIDEVRLASMSFEAVNWDTLVIRGIVGEFSVWRAVAEKYVPPVVSALAVQERMLAEMRQMLLQPGGNLPASGQPGARRRQPGRFRTPRAKLRRQVAAAGEVLRVPPDAAAAAGFGSGSEDHDCEDQDTDDDGADVDNINDFVDPANTLPLPQPSKEDDPAVDAVLQALQREALIEQNCAIKLQFHGGTGESATASAAASSSAPPPAPASIPLPPGASASSSGSANPPLGTSDGTDAESVFMDAMGSGRAPTARVNFTDQGRVQAALGESAYTRMTDAGYKIYYERRAGEHGQYISRYLAHNRGDGKMVLRMVPGSSVRLTGGQDPSNRNFSQ